MNDQSISPVNPAPAPAARPARSRRRTLLVNPAAQRRFVMSISIPTLLMLLVVWGWAWWLERVAFDDVATTGESDSLTSFVPFGIGMFFAMLVFAATVVVQALRVSHRVEGSAYRMIKTMERVRQGDLAQTVTLRKKDHLQELAAELNRLIGWIRTQVPSQTAAAAGGPGAASAPPAGTASPEPLATTAGGR
jgi:HAMP domain-containing protein